MNDQRFFELVGRLYWRGVGGSHDELRVVVDDLGALRRLSGRLHRIAERRCNGYADDFGNYDQRAESRDDRTWRRLTSRALKIAKDHGWALEIQGDPRGAVVKLSLDGSDAWRDTDLLY